jgi:anti-anti-sigma regulatory factor
VQDERALQISALEAEVASLRELLETYEDMVTAQSRDMEQLAEEQRERAGQLSALADELRRSKESAEGASRSLADTVQKLGEANQQLAEDLRQRERAEAERALLQERIVAAHRARLRELSAPLIPITEGILVMPLVGMMDAERAHQAVETALHSAGEYGAAYLIVDITGIKAVDETVAGMLVRMAGGLRLLGTRTVITGIRPEVARTLIDLALSLDALVTKGTLQAGVEHALKAGERGALSFRRRPRGGAGAGE